MKNPDIVIATCLLIWITLITTYVGTIDKAWFALAAILPVQLFFIGFGIYLCKIN